MARILVGTDDGLRVFGLDDGAATLELAGRRVTAVAPEGWNLWAILEGTEVWHTAGEPWWFHVGGVASGRANCIADTRAGVIVGTSDAHLSRVAGEGLVPVLAFDRVDGRQHWYTPWGGPPDSRSISEDDETVYVNVHVGGILRSMDHGDSWHPTIDIDADVHRVLGAPGRVLAACAGGLAVSEDRGDTWTTRSDGLHATYCRGVARSGDTVLVSASDGPRGGRAALYRGPVGDGPFERCVQGLPEWFPGNIDSPCLDAAPDDGLAAFGTEGGRVFASTDQGNTWSEVAAGLPSVNCVLTLP